MREVAHFALPRSVFFYRGLRDARKRVALTFDDGPNAMTPLYLDVLARLGVRATFFLVGENAARMPGLVADYVRCGHEVGGHGWSHAAFSSLRGSRLEEELQRTHEVLGTEVDRHRLVRPPHGALTTRTLVRTAAAGYTSVLWSVDSDDCRSRDPRLVARRIAPEALESGDVVLLHELQPWTLQALPDAVRRLRDNGWELVTVTQLMD